jgi:hypothetical protein
MHGRLALEKVLPDQWSLSHQVAVEQIIGDVRGRDVPDYLIMWLCDT